MRAGRPRRGYQGGGGAGGILLELDSGRYFGLNETGTRIWLLLQEHGSLEPTLRAMLYEYDVAEDFLRRELLSFVETLSSRRLLEIHG